ncbi:MAG: DUF2849 domain-containing protein [Rhodospirillaceae bacterium]
MARLADGLKVVTANRLDSGGAVWFGADDGWQPTIAAAAVFEGAGAESALARAREAALRSGVIEPYLIEVALAESGPRPRSPREQIRSHGPSVRTDLGIQAGQQP